jgi:hypothetical protein
MTHNEAEGSGARTRRSQREIVFEVRRGRLVRHVRLRDGRSYSHFCSREVLEQVAAVIEEHGDAGTTTNELWEALPNAPCTQATVALAFLKDRGLVEVEVRRSFAASRTLVEDAMIEFYLLAEPPQDDPPAAA